MTTYTSPFTGDIVQPTDVSYYALAFSTNQTLAWPAFIAEGVDVIPAARIMDCTPSTGGLIVTLPYGNQASVGTDILFRNLGAVSFTIRDSAGGQSVVLAAGEARYFYLVDNSTEAGVYRSFTYGAGTSSADAASLVGNGLANIGGLLETSTEVVQASSNITFTESDRALAYVWTGGLGTADLPVPATILTGWYVMVRNGGSGALTINAPFGRTINGNATQILYPTDSAIVTYDVTSQNFFTIGLSRQTTVSYTAATYDVDSVVGNTLSLVNFAPSIQTYEAFSGTRTQNLAVTLPAITQIYVISNITGQSGYAITFAVSGTSSPPVSFANGTTAIILTNGTETYVLSQSVTGVFYADNGSVGSPSYTFNSDNGTGLYLNTTHDLRVAANGVDVMSFNAINPLALQVSTAAQFNAALIAGGTF